MSNLDYFINITATKPNALASSGYIKTLSVYANKKAPPQDPNPPADNSGGKAKPEQPKAEEPKVEGGTQKPAQLQAEIKPVVINKSTKKEAVTDPIILLTTSSGADDLVEPEIAKKIQVAFLHVNKVYLVIKENIPEGQEIEVFRKMSELAYFMVDYVNEDVRALGYKGRVYRTISLDDGKTPPQLQSAKEPVKTTLALTMDFRTGILAVGHQTPLNADLSYRNVLNARADGTKIFNDCNCIDTNLEIGLPAKYCSYGKYVNMTYETIDGVEWVEKSMGDAEILRENGVTHMWKDPAGNAVLGYWWDGNQLGSEHPKFEFTKLGLQNAFFNYITLNQPQYDIYGFAGVKMVLRDVLDKMVAQNVLSSYGDIVLPSPSEQNLEDVVKGFVKNVETSLNSSKAIWFLQMNVIEQ